MSVPLQNSPVRQAVEIAVNLGLIFIIVAWCLQILSPFVSLLAWGAIIAISVYPLFLRLLDKLGGRRKLAVTIIAVVGLALVIVPAWMFTNSMISNATEFAASAESGEFHISPPPESVKDWPLVGDRVYEGWTAAAANLRVYLQEYQETTRKVAEVFLKKAAGAGVGVLVFLASILVGAAFLANAESVRAGMLRMCRRLAGDQGAEMLDLTVQTIRSVTVGVLGIAMIQALAGGIGMYAVGIPASGVWTLVILILAIAQLPPWLVLLPMIIYVFSYESTMVSVIFMVWSLVVSFADMVLKPLFLGRGVAVPMLVILLGAIGGMIMRGVMGLFVGAVVLALGYKLFQWWLVGGDPEDVETEVTNSDAAIADELPARTPRQE